MMSCLCTFSNKSLTEEATKYLLLHH